MPLWGKVISRPSRLFVRKASPSRRNWVTAGGRHLPCTILGWLPSSAVIIRRQATTFEMHCVYAKKLGTKWASHIPSKESRALMRRKEMPREQFGFWRLLQVCELASVLRLNKPSSDNMSNSSIRYAAAYRQRHLRRKARRE